MTVGGLAIFHSGLSRSKKLPVPYPLPTRRKIGWGVHSQNDFSNLFPHSGKIVHWLKIEFNRLADILKRLAFALSLGHTHVQSP